MEEVNKLVCRKTLIHINKGNPLYARESKGNPPTGFILLKHDYSTSWKEERGGKKEKKIKFIIIIII